MSARRWWIVILSFAATLGISGWIVWSGWAREGAPPLLPWWAHLAALGVVGVEILARSLKLKWSASAVGLQLPLGTSARVILGGDFAGGITPSRSGAEPARYLIMAEAGWPAAAIILVLFIELFLELVSLVIACVLLTLLFREAGGMIGLLMGVIGAWALLVGGAGIGGWFLAQHHSRGKPPALARKLGFNAGGWRRVQRALKALRRSMGQLRQARLSTLAAATLASLVHVFARTFVLVALVAGLQPGTPTAPLVVWSLVLMFGSSIAPAPAGGGAVEFSFKLAFASVLTASVLGGALIWWRFYTFYLYLLLGALAAGSTVLRALREKPDEVIAEAPTP